MSGEGLVSLEFETMFNEVPDGCKIGLTGSIPELGEWNSERCILAKQSKKEPGRWVAVTELPPLTSVEWKWIVITKDKSKVIRWEERANRVLSTGVMNGQVVAPWNNNHTFAPHQKTKHLFITSSSTSKYTTPNTSKDTLSGRPSLIQRITPRGCVIL